MCAFRPIDNPDQMQVNHIDGDKYNNTLSNLEWSTAWENTAHSIVNGLTPHSKYAHTKEEVYMVLDMYLQGYTGMEIAKAVNESSGMYLKGAYLYCQAIYLANVRQYDVANYLIEHGYTCSALFTKEEVNAIVTAAQSGSRLPEYPPNTPKFIAARVIKFEVTNNMQYNFNYLNT